MKWWFWENLTAVCRSWCSLVGVIEEFSNELLRIDFGLSSTWQRSLQETRETSVLTACLNINLTSGVYRHEWTGCYVQDITCAPWLWIWELLSRTETDQEEQIQCLCPSQQPWPENGPAATPGTLTDKHPHRPQSCVCELWWEERDESSDHTVPPWSETTISTLAPGSQLLLLGFTLYFSGAVVRTWVQDIY